MTRQRRPCTIDFQIPDRKVSGSSADADECGRALAACHGYLDAISLAARSPLPLVAAVNLHAYTVVAAEYEPTTRAARASNDRRSTSIRIVSDDDRIGGGALAVLDGQRSALARGERNRVPGLS